MIKLLLLGGLKKAVGSPSVSLEQSSISISEILTSLKQAVKDPRIFNPGNILIAVNGIECSLIGGNEAVVKSGDTVTIVTVVHGGSQKDL